VLESVHSVTLYAIVSVFITLYSKVKINCQLNRLFSQAPKWMVNYFHKLTISLHLTITGTTSQIIFTWQYHYRMVNYFHKLQSENLRLFSQYNLTVQLKSSIHILCDIIGLQSSRPAIRQRMGSHGWKLQWRQCRLSLHSRSQWEPSWTEFSVSVS